MSPGTCPSKMPDAKKTNRADGWLGDRQIDGLRFSTSPRLHAVPSRLLSCSPSMTCAFCKPTTTHRRSITTWPLTDHGSAIGRGSNHAQLCTPAQFVTGEPAQGPYTTRKKHCPTSTCTLATGQDKSPHMQKYTAADTYTLQKNMRLPAASLINHECFFTLGLLCRRARHFTILNAMHRCCIVQQDNSSGIHRAGPGDVGDRTAHMERTCQVPPAGYHHHIPTPVTTVHNSTHTHHLANSASSISKKRKKDKSTSALNKLPSSHSRHIPPNMLFKPALSGKMKSNDPGRPDAMRGPLDSARTAD